MTTAQLTAPHKKLKPEPHSQIDPQSLLTETVTHIYYCFRSVHFEIICYAEINRIYSQMLLSFLKLQPL